MFGPFHTERASSALVGFMMLCSEAFDLLARTEYERVCT